MAENNRVKRGKRDRSPKVLSNKYTKSYDLEGTGPVFSYDLEVFNYSQCPFVLLLQKVEKASTQIASQMNMMARKFSSWKKNVSKQMIIKGMDL